NDSEMRGLGAGGSGSWILGSRDSRSPQHRHRPTTNAPIPRLIAFINRMTSIFDQWIYAYIIHFHASRECCFIDALLATPVAAHGEVNQPMELLVERPCLVIFSFVLEMEDLHIIHVAANIGRRPVYTIAVEIGRCVFNF